MTVERGVGHGEPGTPGPGPSEAVPAETAFTLDEGDSALFPPLPTGEVRNAGTVEAVAWIASLVSLPAGTPTAGTPTP
jgi:hypothetical protein